MSCYSDNVLMIQKNFGCCSELNGTVYAKLVLVSTDKQMSESNISDFVHEFNKAADFLMDEAAKRNVKLTIRTAVSEMSVSEPDRIGNYKYLCDCFAKMNGFSDYEEYYRYLESTYSQKKVAPVFCVAAKGRSFAHCTAGSVSDPYEYAVVYKADAGVFAHEFLHLFGAADYYYPFDFSEYVQKKLDAPSIMLSSGYFYIDDLTSYLVGWDRYLSVTACLLLDKTAHLTSKQYSDEIRAQTDADFVRVNNLNTIYEGPMKNGFYEGKGKLVFKSGGYYEGEFKGGNYNGHGKRVYEDGSVYEGEFKEDNYHGHGKRVYEDGSVYEGEFKDGSYDGYGILKYKNGSEYEGEFRNGLYHGHGRLKFSSGTEYEGEFSSGVYHGYGRVKYCSGSVYEGEFKNGEYDGIGTLTYTDGRVKSGIFIHGWYEGKGTDTPAAETSHKSVKKAYQHFCSTVFGTIKRHFAPAV